MRRREGRTGAMTTDDAELMVQGARVGLGSRLIYSIYSIRSYQMYVWKIGKNGLLPGEFLPFQSYCLQQGAIRGRQ